MAFSEYMDFTQLRAASQAKGAYSSSRGFSPTRLGLLRARRLGACPRRIAVHCGPENVAPRWAVAPLPRNPTRFTSRYRSRITPTNHTPSDILIFARASPTPRYTLTSPSGEGPPAASSWVTVPTSSPGPPRTFAPSALV